MQDAKKNVEKTVLTSERGTLKKVGVSSVLRAIGSDVTIVALHQMLTCDYNWRTAHTDICFIDRLIKTHTRLNKYSNTSPTFVQHFID